MNVSKQVNVQERMLDWSLQTLKLIQTYRLKVTPYIEEDVFDLFRCVLTSLYEALCLSVGRLVGNALVKYSEKIFFFGF